MVLGGNGGRKVEEMRGKKGTVELKEKVRQGSRKQNKEERMSSGGEEGRKGKTRGEGKERG